MTSVFAADNICRYVAIVGRAQLAHVCLPARLRCWRDRLGPSSGTTPWTKKINRGCRAAADDEGNATKGQIDTGVVLHPAMHSSKNLYKLVERDPVLRPQARCPRERIADELEQLLPVSLFRQPLMGTSRSATTSFVKWTSKPQGWVTLRRLMSTKIIEQCGVTQLVDATQVGVSLDSRPQFTDSGPGTCLSTCRQVQKRIQKIPPRLPQWSNEQWDA